MKRNKKERKQVRGFAVSKRFKEMQKAKEMREAKERERLYAVYCWSYLDKKAIYERVEKEIKKILKSSSS